MFRLLCLGSKLLEVGFAPGELLQGLHSLSAVTPGTPLERLSPCVWRGELLGLKPQKHLVF